MLEVLARIRHRRTRRQLSPYLDGMLSERENRRLEAHLARCRACRDELADLQAAVQALAELPLVESPRSFALTAAPRRVEALRPAARRVEFGLRLATAAAAFVLAIVAAGDLLGVPGGDEGQEGEANLARMEAARSEAGSLTAEAQPSEGTAEDKAAAEAPTLSAPAPGVVGPATGSPAAGMGSGEEGTPPSEAPVPNPSAPPESVPGITEPATPAATATIAATAAPAATAPAPETPPALTETPVPAETPTPVPAETPTPVETPSVAIVEYTLRPGESVSDVAASFGTTAETILALNGLADPSLVVAGQRLLVPEPAEGTTAPPPIGAQTAPSETEEQPLSEADQALAEAERDSLAAEGGGPSRERVLRWLEIGLATGVALLFVSWLVARRRGRA
jgi:LysM repeat protein